MKPAAILALTLPLLTMAAQQAPSGTEITFRSSSDLVLVNVIARNKNGLPDQTLKRDDFQLFDDDRPISIQTFDTAAQSRPLALWFVVLCNMAGYEKQGSGLFQGRIHLLMPALKELGKQDTLGVAHWCDDGQSKLDLLPTRDVDQAATTLEQTLAPRPSPKNHDRPGELALQETMRLIVDATRSSQPEPLPVLVFLYDDWSGMPKHEADQFISQLLETSAIAFGLKDRRSPGMWFPVPGEQKEIAHYIVAQTGGEYLPVTPATYATGLEEILHQLHFRYELGFKPETLDGQRHKLRVELTASAKNQRQGVRLRYRAAYVPIAR